MLSLIFTTCWVVILGLSFNVLRTRGSETVILCYKSRKILGFWLLTNQNSANWWKNFLGFLGWIFIALGERKSSNEKLVTSSLSLHLDLHDWIKTITLFFSKCRSSPSRTTINLFFFACRLQFCFCFFCVYLVFLYQI